MFTHHRTLNHSLLTTSKISLKQMSKPPPEFLGLNSYFYLKIMEYNILSLPALVIDGKVIVAGKRLSLSEVKELITK